MIIVYPDSRLRTVAYFNRWNLEAERVAEKVGRELQRAKNGIGLAAPQVGEKVRLFAGKNLQLAGPKAPKLELVINPRFQPLDQKTYPYYRQQDHHEPFLEGCLSLPGLWGAVKRHLQIKASWQTLRAGKLVNREAILTGLAAIVFQHELDHLDGILFIDHIRQANGRVYRLKGDQQIEVPLPTDDRLTD